MATYMTLEESLPILNSCTFLKYKFHTEDGVRAAVEELPGPSCYQEGPEGGEKVVCDGAKQSPPPKRGRPITPTERIKLTRPAKILNLADNRQATVVEKYVKEEFKRMLIGTELQGEENNCLTEAILLQLVNKDFMEDSITHQVYTPQHLRLQCIMYAVENCEEVTPLLTNYMSGSVKEYLFSIIPATSECDFPMLILARLLLEVRDKFHYYTLNDWYTFLNSYACYAV